VIVDAHIHFWRLTRGDNIALLPSMTSIFRDKEPQDLKPRLNAAGVNRIVVVQAAETFAETLFIVGLARKFPWISGIVAWIDPASPSVEEEAAALSWIPVVKGVRPVRDDNRSISWMLEQRYEQAWRAIAANGLSLDILVQDWRELPFATALVKNNPKLTFILDHCGKPDIAAGLTNSWAQYIEDLAKFPNVMCKFSGLLNCANPGAVAADLSAFTTHVLNVFTPSRVMWASDWPPLDLAGDYERWKAISVELIQHLPSDQHIEVMSGTATRVYRLNQ